MKQKERERGTPSPCKTCERPYSPLRKGECVTCYRYRKKRGKKRPYGVLDGRPVGVLRGKKHPAWKGDAATDESKRERVQRAYALGACELCGKPATDRHHRNGDPGDNDILNIQPLCRRCHMQIDGRLDVFKSTSKGLISKRTVVGSYPDNWKFISDDVCRRAGHRCIRCGHPYRKGAHGNGQWTPCDEKCNHKGPISTINGVIHAEWRILTVHHFDGNKSNCEWHNLLALCQRCHLQIQAKVDPEQPWFLQHSEWIKPYVAGFYAKKYENRQITREEAIARLEELLRYELRIIK